MISIEDFLNNDLLFSWLLILGFSLASVLGASLVYVDLLFGSGVETTKKWLKYAWPLSGGILLYSTQISLVPHAYQKLVEIPYFEKSPIIYFVVFYCAGIICTHIMSALVNFIAPSAIDTCESHSHAHAHAQSHSKIDLESNYSSSQLNDFHNDHSSHESQIIECSQINPIQTKHYGTMADLPSKGIEHQTNSHSSLNEDTCTCDRTPLDQICKNIPYPDYRRMSIISHISENEIPLTTTNSYTHPDQQAKQLGWKISIQTAVAIACHKLPEGLLMIVGNSVNQKLGFSLFLGLFIHNFPEGFTLAIPMLMSTGSRTKAFLFAASIGGLTQPIGGLIGTLMVDYIDPTSFKLVNAIVLSSVSGMMLTVVLQCIRSIFQSYSQRETKLKYLLLSFITGLVGMILINWISHLFGN